MKPYGSRGTGILVIFYFGICFLSFYYGFDYKRTRNDDFLEWAFLASALIASFHALSIWIQHKRYPGHGAPQSQGLWYNVFLFIPVIIWPFIFGALSIYFFLS